MNDLLSIPVDLIDLGDRLRPVKPEPVELLKADIEMQGLLQPIVVAPAGERFVLVVGAYRLAAVRELGWAEIPATVVRDLDEAQLRIAEIMENVDRQELSKLEPGDYWFGIRPSHIGLVPTSDDDLEMSMEVELSEISGSETFMHVENSHFEMVMQLMGVHQYHTGAPIKVYLPINKLFVFDNNEQLVHTPSQVSGGSV